MANKIKYGLRSVYYAKITEGAGGAITYGSPVAIPGAVNLSLSGVGDTNDFYADDTIYYSSTANQGYEGDLEIALIPQSFYTDILGLTTDSNGALIENADATVSAFALGFEVQGDNKPRRTWLYNCKASRPNQDAQTAEAGITPATETLSIKVMPRIADKNVKVTMEKSNTNETAYNGFFSAVYEKTGSV